MLRHFFRGTLRREEVASAYLATLFEHDEAFRRGFLARLGHEVDAASWEVVVEAAYGEKRIDVRAASGDTVLLIENKVAAGALQQGQLVGYYTRELEMSDEKRIVVAMVAPGGSGRDEVERLRGHEAFRASDRVEHVSWQDVLDLAQTVGGTMQAFAHSGAEAIAATIARAKETKYPIVGGREELRAITERVMAALPPTERAAIWSAATFDEIFTHKRSITLWFDLVFEDERRSDLGPLGEGSWRLLVRSRAKLAAKARKTPVAERWAELTRAGLEVAAPSGRHEKRDAWMSYETIVEGTADEIAERAGGMLVALAKATAL